MLNIAVIDYDMGNLHSACKALEKVGGNPEITDSPQKIDQADGVVLPGVGAFDPAMQHLRERNLEEVIKRVIDQGKPFLGICLGLQILFEESEEGIEKGLGIIKGKVKRFVKEDDITIPHMGWNNLEFGENPHSLWQNLPSQPSVYFVHSYYVQPVDLCFNCATVTHGSQKVTAAIAKNNLMAVQFHPEKSSSNGLQILSNFINLISSNKI